MSKRSDAVVVAFNRGYRAVNGEIHSPFGRIIRGCKKDGYLVFGLKFGYSVKVPFHRLVAFQKFGDRIFAPGIVVRHLDGNRINNLESNIEIGTHSENMFDIPKEARLEKASKANQQHAPELIEKLRQEHADGVSYKALKSKYGLPKSTLSYYLSTRAKRTSFSFPKARP